LFKFITSSEDNVTEIIKQNSCEEIFYSMLQTVVAYCLSLELKLPEFIQEELDIWNAQQTIAQATAAAATEVAPMGLNLDSLLRDPEATIRLGGARPGEAAHALRDIVNQMSGAQPTPAQTVAGPTALTLESLQRNPAATIAMARENPNAAAAALRDVVGQLQNQQQRDASQLNLSGLGALAPQLQNLISKLERKAGSSATKSVTTPPVARQAPSVNQTSVGVRAPSFTPSANAAAAEAEAARQQENRNMLADLARERATRQAARTNNQNATSPTTAPRTTSNTFRFI